MNIFRLFASIRSMPRVTIDLMLRETESNDPFYGRIVRDFLREANRPHPRWRIVNTLTWGVALLLLPRRFEDYFMRIEAAARRNYKKALRNGCACRSLDYNRHLEEIAAIRASAPVRQGRMSADFLYGPVQPCANPPSRNPCHAYRYFGVFKDNRLAAYAGCAVYGELAMIEHIYGHADYQELGVIPLLIADMAATVMRDHPAVRYYGYGTFLGAAKPLQRFKRKMGFTPHHVRWEPGATAVATVEQRVFRKVGAPQRRPPEIAGLRFVMIDGARAAWQLRNTLRRDLGWGGWVKTMLKTATKRRCFYGVIADGNLIHTGWLSLGFCRYYAVEDNAVVVGPIGTFHSARGRGAATMALQTVMREMTRQSRSIFYIDTAADNIACLKVIEKCGFGPPVGMIGKKACATGGSACGGADHVAAAPVM